LRRFFPVQVDRSFLEYLLRIAVYISRIVNLL
jgi:hypothetical protein